MSTETELDPEIKSPMKIHIYDGFFRISEVGRHRNCLFVFDANDAGQGRHDTIHYCANSIGIPTKKSCTNHPKSFFTDDEYWGNVIKLNKYFEKIRSRCAKYDILVMPQGGLGTGLSQLSEKAPDTYRYLTDQLDHLIDNSILVDIDGHVSDHSNFKYGSHCLGKSQLNYSIRTLG